MEKKIAVCQRPKRASSISTVPLIVLIVLLVVCQRPKRASSISTENERKKNEHSSTCVSTP